MILIVLKVMHFSLNFFLRTRQNFCLLVRHTNWLLGFLQQYTKGTWVWTWHFPFFKDRQMWSSSCALMGETLAFEISLFTVTFLCIKRKSSLIIHVLFNVLDVRTPDSLLLRSTWTELYNQKDARATLRQVWSAQLITCKKCRAMYIEYPGRRIGGKFGEHLRSVEGHHQQHLFHLHLHFFFFAPW